MNDPILSNPQDTPIIADPKAEIPTSPISNVANPQATIETLTSTAPIIANPQAVNNPTLSNPQDTPIIANPTAEIKTPPTPNIVYLKTNIAPIQPNSQDNPRNSRPKPCIANSTVKHQSITSKTNPDINHICGIENDQETINHPEEQSALADAYIQELIDQGFKYAQSVEAFTFFTDSAE